jgi:hypothetical protein
LGKANSRLVILSYQKSYQTVRTVHAESLRDYVRARVKELARPLGSEQEPQFVKGRDAQDYVLERVN